MKRQHVPPNHFICNNNIPKERFLNVSLHPTANLSLKMFTSAIVIASTHITNSVIRLNSKDGLTIE
jgi:hypothetical protein